MNIQAPTAELWDINQGKRLIKRLRKCGVVEGGEVAFLIQALRTAAATVAVDQAKGEGKSAAESTLMAMEAVERVKLPEYSGSNVGRTLFEILVVNGSAPGRVKMELDKVLFVAGFSNDIGSAHKLQSGESPDYTADRFPESPRKNY